MPTNFFGHKMRGEKLEHLVTSGIIKGKCSRKIAKKKDVGWTRKVTKNRMNDRCIKSNKESRCVEDHDRLQQRAEHLID